MQIRIKKTDLKDFYFITGLRKYKHIELDPLNSQVCSQNYDRMRLIRYSKRINTEMLNLLLQYFEK